MSLDDDSPQMIIRVEREALERQLSRMLGRSLPSPVVFEPVGDLTDSAASRWHGALNILSAEVMSPASLIQQRHRRRRARGADRLDAALRPAVQLLRATGDPDPAQRPGRRGPLDRVHRAAPRRADRAGGPGGLRPDEPSLDPGRLPAGPGHHADRRSSGRAASSRYAARCWRRCPGDGVNVTDVAQRWGFTHLGNFSVVYRQEFGESPSQTLRRPAVTADA